MAVRFFTEETTYILKNKRILRNWIEEIILSHHKTCGDINFIFTSNAQILEINLKYLKHDYFTDIITFNYNQADVISGDIYISVDTVKKNAEEYLITFQKEIHRVIIHGILHLLGLDDQSESDKEKMHLSEDKSLMLLETKL